MSRPNKNIANSFQMRWRWDAIAQEYASRRLEAHFATGGNASTLDPQAISEEAFSFATIMCHEREHRVLMAKEEEKARLDKEKADSEALTSEQGDAGEGSGMHLNQTTGQSAE